MSTRCNIIIKDGPRRITLYHHHDGYPEGVGTELQDYLRRKWSQDWRHGWEGFYIANDLVKGHILYPLSSDGREDDEYEVTSGLHGDVEYVYVINCRAMAIRCYEVPWDDEYHQDFCIRWDRVFRRRNLVAIPSVEERKKMLKVC